MDYIVYRTPYLVFYVFDDFAALDISYMQFTFVVYLSRYFKIII